MSTAPAMPTACVYLPDVAQAARTAQQQTMQQVWQHLLHFSPAIEIDAQHPGVLWLDPNGLQHLFGTHAQWAEAIRQSLAVIGRSARIVVGFNRYFIRVSTRQVSTYHVFEDPAREAAMASAVPVEAAPLPEDVRRTLLLLGVATLGEFLRMPVDEVRQCLGEAAENIHRSAHNRVWTPLTPQKYIPPLEAEYVLEPPDNNMHRLLFALKSMLQPLLDKLQSRCQACAGLHLQLQLEGGESLFEHVAPATPGLDARKLLELLHLRLAATVLPRPVSGITLRLAARCVRPEQLMMLQQKPKRDVRAAAGALAKVRALLGEASVTRADLCDSWLPESSFRWDLLAQVTLPEVVEVPHGPAAPFPMMRAVHRVRRPLPPPPKRNMRAWLRHDGAVEHMHGPYRLQNGWWHRSVDRDYYYIQTDMRKCIWVYYSRTNNRWFRQGHMD